MNQGGSNIPSKLGRKKNNFHCTFAVSDNTFRNLLRNDSTKVKLNFDFRSTIKKIRSVQYNQNF